MVPVSQQQLHWQQVRVASYGYPRAQAWYACQPQVNDLTVFLEFFGGDLTVSIDNAPGSMLV